MSSTGFWHFYGHLDWYTPSISGIRVDAHAHPHNISLVLEVIIST